MRILCSNDDGIHARGLTSLVKVARELSDDVWVVAPHEEQSGAGRSLTLHNPLRLRQHDEKRFSVSGTPTDAVMMAVSKIMTDKKPDLVLSGVNNGQNIAEDLTFSGTVAAALQGMAMGIPSVALSLARLSRDEAKWETPEAHGADLLRKLLKIGWPKDVIMNINFPDRVPDDVSGTRITHQGHRDVVQLFVEERADLRGGPYYWFGYKGTLSDPDDGTDLRAVYDGSISITPVHLALTHEATVNKMVNEFSR